jgi:hypothetical protein
MSKEDIILLAIKYTIHGLKFNEDGLLRFAALVASAERESCAKICEQLLERPCGYLGEWEGYATFATEMTAQECAIAIRAKQQA